ncbi:hypothetical protein [Corynebacterium terpenotabidum]|uniref:Uncharacterized protein n=1 Tax=Corynebacterium terpenotabidum Y-11 TaxID=1200352 RepID=S4XEA3_9CORY|nr:hypothetical protein [Corynebacterium terpenotabidum]AGP31457.1 hypothetical protein A606_09080 [Corynebacterium terpenotabidum Y-11]
MSHYNLYSALGLDRSATCVELIREIDARLASGTIVGSLGEELTLARAVLGNPYRRQLYDQKLADPYAPQITQDALRQLSSLPVASAPETAPEVSPTRAFTPVSSEPHAPRSRWPLFAAIGIIVVAVAVSAGLIVKGGSDDSDEGYADATFTQAETAVTTTTATPTSVTSEPVTPVGLEKAPVSDHHGDTAVNEEEDICGGRVCDTAVVYLDGAVELSSGAFTQDYVQPVTTITVTDDAFSRSFSSVTGDTKKSQYISGISVYSRGDGQLHILLVNAVSGLTMQPRLLPDGQRIVIDIYPG